MSRRAERDLSEGQLEEDEQEFLQEHSIDIGGKAGDTPSSVLLAPVQERIISRRSRKERRAVVPQPSGFPQPLSSERAPSLFARNYAKERAPSGQPSAPNQPATDADLRFQAMSEAERKEALEEIYSRMSPEIISYLRGRSKTKKRGWRSLRNAQLGSTEDMDKIMGVDMDIRPGTTERDDQPMDVCMSDADVLSADLRKVQLEQNDGIGTAEDTSSLVNQGLPKEEEKLEWMRDASRNTGGQQEMEAAMQKCVEELGDISRRRFDLNGKMLTAEQVQNLPTHLGLHHHGSNPSDAGYTLTEILLLTRSTVHTQRAMAYTVFSRVVTGQRELVAGPLLKSGALPLAFANLKEMSSSAPNPAAATAQLLAVEAVLKPLHDVGVRELSQDVYFASLFYSPCALTNSMPVLKVLQTSDLVPSLITFAHMWFMNKQFDFTIRALYAARALVKSCDVATGKELLSKTSLNHLYDMANGSGNITSLATFLACDILAYYLLFVGWGELHESEAGSFLYGDRNLKSIGGCMQFYLNLPQKVSDEVHLASAASLRVLRGALTFDRGIEVFRDCLSAVCAVSFAHQHHSSELGTTASSIASREALLALESYVHALYSTANQIHTDRETTSTSKSDNATVERAIGSLQERQNEALYAEIVALVPLARSAAHLFVQDGFSSHQAAAGHFASSVFALHRDPITSDLIPSVLQRAKKSSEDLSKLSSNQVATSVSFAYFQRIASCAHAAGRMLSKSVLPDSVVGQICRNLISVVEFEGDYQWRQGQPFIRPAANAAAEWLVKFAQLRPNREAVLRAIQLLPHLGEPQVAMELVFKCIVHPPLLEVLNSKVTRSLGNHIVDKLTTLTLTKLLNEQNLRSRGEIEKGKETLVTFSNIVQWWLCSPDTVEEGALVAGTLVKSDLVSSTGIYRALLHASPMTFVTGSMLSELVLISGTKSFRDKNLAFHPHWNTRLSIYSAEKRPPLAEIFFQLASRLTERGPFICEEGKSNVDALASLILTTMCRRDAHISLRQHLWRETVSDCGGGTLFAYAQFLGDIPSIENEDDDDEMLASYSQALSSGLLFGERCPHVLQQIICARICARLQKAKNMHTLDPLISCVSQRRKETEETLMGWLLKWRGDEDVSLVRGFLSTQPLAGNGQVVMVHRLSPHVFSSPTV